MFSVAVTPQTTFGNNINNSKVVKTLTHLEEVFRSNSDFKIIEEFVSKMLEAARSAVPVRTGNLKRNIKMEKTSTGFRFYVDSKGANYGQYVEFGTRRQRAQPYFGPAVERNRDPLRQALLKYYRGV